jgi:hypothetical protein
VNYIFIDESGELGNQTYNILLVAVIVNESEYPKINRIIKNLRRGKYKNELKHKNEIKTNKLKYEIKINLLKAINKLDIVVNVINFRKRKLKKFENKNKLYDYIAGELICKLNFDCDTEIIIDKSKGKKILIRDFNHHIMNKINSKYKIIINHRHSHSWEGLQIADLIAWSYFQKYEHNNEKYIEILTIEKNAYEI